MITNSTHLFFSPIPVIKSRAGQTLKFSGSDTEERLSHNKQIPAWQKLWKDVDVEYRYNSLGYRFDEQIDLSKSYALAVGCSHTEGTGLNYDQVWTHRLQTRLGMPVINLGAGGSGNDWIYTTLLGWLSNYKQIQPSAVLPEIVYVQWTQTTRRAEIKQWGYYETIGPNFGKGPVWHTMARSNLNNFGLETWRYYKSSRLILNNMGIVNIHFKLEQRHQEDEFKYIQQQCDWHWLTREGNSGIHIPGDFARDWAHFGPKTHETIAIYLEDIRHGRNSWIDVS